MSHYTKKSSRILAAMALLTALTPATSHACACGCGIFEVGTSSMLPTQPGGTAFLEYDFMNQDINWHGAAETPAFSNADKNIKSDFVTAGAQYMFNRDWGMEATVPYTFRHFVTTDDSDDIVSSNHSAVGDIRLKGIYSGFSPDMSTGITFGLKLPTGDYSYPGFDRDTEIGSGSTDLLLGAYHMGAVTKEWNWFANGLLDQPMLTTAGYRPGSEVDAVTGVYYNDWAIGNVKIAPVAQILGSYRLRDTGPAADIEDSGYQRILLSPGIEADMGAMKLYADVEFPVYQRVNGDQLTAPRLFKLNISHSF